MSLALLAGIVFLQSCSSGDDEELGTGGSSSSVWNGTTKYATYDSSLEDNTGEVLIKGGTLTAIATASGARGIKTEGDITINEDKGTVVVTATSSQHEGMEAKGTISISGGSSVSLSAYSSGGSGGHPGGWH